MALYRTYSLHYSKRPVRRWLRSSAARITALAASVPLALWLIALTDRAALPEAAKIALGIIPAVWLVGAVGWLIGRGLRRLLTGQ